MLFSYVFNLLNKVCGAGLAVTCADFYRKLSGKPPVWTSHQPLPPAMRLPNTALDGNSRPMFSLLIATINRKEPLEKLFDSLRQQTIPTDAFEILVADQNSPGFLQPIIDDYAQFLRIKVIQVPNKGVSQARNALLPLATGRYVAFPDDDCCYEPDTLYEVQAFFTTRLHVHAIQGSWSAPGSRRDSAHHTAYLGTRYSVFRRGETYVHFFRKQAVERIGLFDPRIGPGTGLPYGCGEDTDYLLRAIEAGLTVMHVPSVHVRHNEVDVLAAKANIQKISSYAIGRMYLLHKHHLPLWFQLFNIAYPLLRMPMEGAATARYRFIMFAARLKGFFCVRFGTSPKP
ncbi:MAG: glycosyltransferase family A protein [Desulfovibrio sp.]|uniref:glycosyltransferase family 2 protein n=1 Tax=Desulfovibrio sp. TaxID=885 RepID=UPI0039E5E3EF